jgi:signal peptidase II
MRSASPAGWTRWLVLSAIVIVADLATKAWISRAFAPGEVVTVTPFFNLVLVYNTGAAFSFLAGAGGWQRWFFMTISIVVSAAIVYMLGRKDNHPILSAALALVLGGALGNLYDRATLGHVVDFVQLHAAGYYWPAFNVADSAITVGVALLVWDSLMGKGGEAGIRKPGEDRT